MSSVAPPRLFVRFSSADAVPVTPSHGRLTRYRVESLQPVRGQHGLSFGAGAEIARHESELPPAALEDALVGVTQHVLYTDAAQRAELAKISSPESGPCAVLIPIKKSAEWWALAQDERHAQFAGAGRAKGHTAIGTPYAARIFRRLYHARYLPGSAWDFLTYFEFPAAEAGSFRQLLNDLRNPELNPEWRLVEAEVELWLTKL